MYEFEPSSGLVPQLCRFAVCTLRKLAHSLQWKSEGLDGTRFHQRIGLGL